MPQSGEIIPFGSYLSTHLSTQPYGWGECTIFREIVRVQIVPQMKGNFGNLACAPVAHQAKSRLLRLTLCHPNCDQGQGQTSAHTTRPPEILSPPEFRQQHDFLKLCFTDPLSGCRALFVRILHRPFECLNLNRDTNTARRYALFVGRQHSIGELREILRTLRRKRVRGPIASPP